MITPIPPVDAIPVPAPIWFLKTLLYVTFLIHVIFMNLILGGNLLAAVFAFKGKAKHLAAARRLVVILPYVTAFAILFGVAPLLFVQVLYGPLFYTSAILLGTPFILIIPVLITAYSLMYAMARWWERLGDLRPWLSLVNLFLLGYIGFVWVNIFTLMLEPDRFKDKYLAHPGGWQLNLVDPTVLPRFLHMFLGAIAVTGLYLAIRGARRIRFEPEQGRWQFRSGATWFAGATIVNMVVGLWWLVDLPKDEMTALMGGNMFGSIALGLGLLAGLASLALALLGINSLKPGRYLWGAACALVVTLLCMIVMRDVIRDAALRTYYDVARTATHPQWGAIGLFLVLFAAAIWLSVFMLNVLKKGAPVDNGATRGPGLTDSGVHKASPAESGIRKLLPSDSGPIKAGPSTSGVHRLDDQDDQ
jgi:hypothetical protein